MSKQRPLFKLKVFWVTGLVVYLVLPSLWAEAASSGSSSRRESGLYRDVFDQSLYYEGTQHLHLERLYRSLFSIRKRARNVNAFEEVPDSTFFVNRHGRQRFSEGELKKGPDVTARPDPGGKWTITKGKFEGLTPGFFIRDSKGDSYLLKFDSLDYPELNTAAESVTSRFFHALGYFVPQYTVVSFKRDQLEIDPNAWVYDESGFRKKLTPERLEEFFLFIPQNEDGRYRASASRILEGEILGSMRLQGLRRDDPEDSINREERREIRALQVFAAWLNNNDMRESNGLDVVQDRDGQKRIWHYLIDFGSSLGAAAGGPKPPMFGHEYMLDYRQTIKAVLSLGFWKKPWQKRWEAAGHEIEHPSVGYFDNRNFNPGGYKTQLPYFSFKDLTRADGFWAAKILMRFTDDDIKEVVSTGEYSDKKAEQAVAETLIERRNLTARYWFKKVNPLDEFQIFKENDSYEIRFVDLAVRHGFVPEKGSVYHFDLIGQKGKRGTRLVQKETEETAFTLGSSWFREYPTLDVLIRTRRTDEKQWSPFVRIKIESDSNTARLAGILHPD